jgi:hypothetical protein
MLTNVCQAGVRLTLDAAMTVTVPTFVSSRDAVAWAEQYKATPDIVGILCIKYMAVLKELDQAEDMKDKINIGILTAQLERIKRAVDYLEINHVGAEVYIGEEPYVRPQAR